MNFTPIFLDTFIPEYPKIINSNFASTSRYLDIFYDGSLGILTKPLLTTGRVKGARGEFVTAVVDNLIVKNQFTNLYDNNTTADYNYYRMFIDPLTAGRDACTASNYWPYENPAWKYIDVNKPYYKISNENPIAFYNNNLSQVVGIYLDPSLFSSDPFKIVLDPCSGSFYQIDSSLAGDFFMEFICTAYDPSWGASWEQYKYGLDSGAGGEGNVGPGTPNYLPVFNTVTSIVDSSLYISGDTLVTQSIQAEGLIDLLGLLTVDGSIILNGEELGAAKYNTSLDPSLAMPTSVGGILAGTTVADLYGKTFIQLFDNLLFPTVLASITTAINGSLIGISSAILEVGTMYGPSGQATFIPGQITNGNGVLDGPVAGDANYYTFKRPGGTVDGTYTASGNSQSHDWTDISIGLSTYVWSVDISYNGDSTPYYDNKGNAGSNLNASKVASSITRFSGTITGQNRRYWGTSSVNPPAVSSDVTGLDNSELSNSVGKTFTIPNGGGEYIYYAIPARLGHATTFTVGGFSTTFIEYTVSVTNNTAVPFTENYYVYRSFNPQSGTNIPVVIS